MIYDSYRYIYPPRPENKIPIESLSLFDNGSLIAEPKFNGTCGPMFFNQKIFKAMNRHNAELTTYKLDPAELRDLFSNKKWNSILGEYMNMSKKDTNSVFNHKFVIFDTLVYNGEYLLGTTFEERWLMLYNRFKHNIIKENDYSYQISDNTWLVKIWYENFESIWNKITKIDMIEGLVLKKKDAKLLVGNVEKNNNKSQFKCRKSTLNYQY